MLSFSDLKFEQWPAVLITNPKDAQYLHPGAEPLGRIRRSTHIRYLCAAWDYFLGVGGAFLLCFFPRDAIKMRALSFRNRILAFSEAPITAVHVSIDGEPLGKGRLAGGPLYVLPWDPSLYLAGLHTIKVKVEVSLLPRMCTTRR